MKYDDFLIRFNQQAFSIDYNRQLDLAIAVCKKLYFEYVEFSKKYHWGDEAILFRAIKILEESKIIEIQPGIIDQALIQIDSVTPDMEDYGSDELASYALNACVAVYNSLQFLLDKDPQHIFDIGICLTDTVDFKIQEQQVLTEQEIESNPLMIEARKYLIEMTR